MIVVFVKSQQVLIINTHNSMSKAGPGETAPGHAGILD